jgi:hypothetical protein
MFAFTRFIAFVTHEVNAMAARMNKTISIRSDDNATWKRASKMLRYYQDESLGDYLTQCLESYISGEQTRQAAAKKD